MNFQKITQSAKRFTAPVAAGALMLAGSAHAAPVDVSSAVSTIEDAIGPVTDIGLAVLGVVVVVRLFGWIRGAVR